MPTEQEQPREGESVEFQGWLHAEEEADKVFSELIVYIDQHKPGALDPGKVEVEALELYGEKYEAAKETANELFRKWKERVELLLREQDEDEPPTDD